MADITGANAIFTISVSSIFPAPIQLQGFAADDVFETDPLGSVETLMGVDGLLSGGFVFVPVTQRFTLQADSPSITIFDAWWGQMQTQQAVFTATGIAVLPNVGKKWALVKGFLREYQPLPNVKKLLQPQRFSIQWQQVTSAIP